MTRNFLITLAILGLTNCSNFKGPSAPIQADKIDYIIFGRYCGNAAFPPYARMFKIEKNRLLVDTTDSFYNNNRNIVFNGDTATKEQFDKTLTLRQNIYEFFLTSKDSVYGNPDNRDQCGLYLEFKFENKIRRFDFDPYKVDDYPIEIKNTSDVLQSLLNDLDN